MEQERMPQPIARGSVRLPSQHTQAVLDSLTSHIAVLDHTGTIVAVNRAWREFAAANPPVTGGVEEGVNYLAVCDRAMGSNAEEAAPFAAGIRAVLAGREQVFTLEYPCHSPTERRWFSGRVTRLRGVEPPHVVVIHENITARRLAEEEGRAARDELEERVRERTRALARANLELRREIAERLGLERTLLEAQRLESLGSLAGGIAQDFSSLLGMIASGIEQTLDSLDSTSQQAELLRQADLAARRAADLTQQLLAYAGRSPLALRRVEVNVLLEELRVLLQASVSKHVSLALCLAPDLPAIEADPVQLRQVVTCLVINASEAIGEQPGTIAVSSRVRHVDRAYLATTLLGEGLEEGRYVTLEVRDTGAGMDPEVVRHAFEPFYTTKSLGRGLGLAAVQGIVRAHGGTVDVSSVPGEGSTFTVLLPAVETASNGIAVELPEPAVRHGGVVLVADDEAGIRNDATRMLESLGFRVLTAADGPAAVEAFRQHADEISCVLLDLTMPRMGGDQVLREITSLKPDARVVFMSGYTRKEATSPLAGSARTGFLYKPFTLTELAVRMRQVLSS